MICNHPGARFVVVKRGPFSDTAEELCETCEQNYRRAIEQGAALLAQGTHPEFVLRIMAIKRERGEFP